jgi:hypothetical protein
MCYSAINPNQTQNIWMETLHVSAPEPKSEPMPEMSPKQKPDPEPLTSDDSDFESAKESPALKPRELRESPNLLTEEEQVKEGPYFEPETKLIEGGPQFKTKSTYKPLAKSSYWTEPRPE